MPTGLVGPNSANVGSHGATVGSAIIYQQPDTGSIAPIGIITNKTSHVAQGGLSFAGTLFRAGTHPAAGAIGPFGAVTKQTVRVAIGGLTFAGSVFRAITKIVTGSLTSTASLNVSKTPTLYWTTIRLRGRRSKMKIRGGSGTESPLY